jgi:hypothetical protein
MDASVSGYADGREARTGIGSSIAFYNGPKPHQALRDLVVRPAGVAGPIGQNALDMMDNAKALRT